MNLQDLKTEMPYKWREQSVNARGATMVAYIDARQLFDKLDEVCGVENWQSDFKVVDGKLFGGIGIKMPKSGEWVWKWDTGSESNVEKEKGEVSDAVKRAGVQWGVGRFLYTLGIVTLKSAEYNGKFRPADDNGKIIWDREELTELCMRAVKEGQLDRTKLKPTASPSPAPKTAPKPFLNKGTTEFTKVVDALKKGFTLEQVELKYRLSKEVKGLLEEVIKGGN